MIKKEILVFGVVGSLTVLVDFISYFSLYNLLGLDIKISKASGFLVGTLFAYVVNRKLTFGHVDQTKGSGTRFIVLYAATLFLNVLLNSVVYSASGNELAAFIGATVCSAAMNFLGMKFYAFKKSAE